MQNILPPQIYLTTAFDFGIAVRHRCVGINNFTMLIPVNTHAVRQQRIQPHHSPHAITDYLRVGISPQKQVNHGRLTKYKRGHFGIRRIMEQEIQRMRWHSFLALPFVFVDMKRQAGDGFSQNANTCILTFLPLADLPKTNGQPLK